jgi:hypothetical protein
MNRHERRAASQHLRKENATYPDQLCSVPEIEWPRREPGMIALCRSSRFLVQVYDAGGGKYRLSVCRTEINNKGEWQDNITWEELQEIKNQCGFSHLDAIEIYPRQADVVNVANMRHLWVLPIQIAFAWRN